MASLSAYDELLLDLKPRLIRSERDYERVVAQIGKLMQSEPSREEGQMIDLLASLVQQYEAEHYPIERVPPAELMAHLMEAREVSQAQLASATGISKSVLSNVLAGRRALSKAGALKLASYFRLPVEYFLQEVSSRPRSAGGASPVAMSKARRASKAGGEGTSEVRGRERDDSRVRDDIAARGRAGSYSEQRETGTSSGKKLARGKRGTRR